ncbi:MAG: Asp-tRNA(Asn)/Glu-tRNA(Gln) amidotransferase subunit GatC [Thermotogota bacterium]
MIKINDELIQKLKKLSNIELTSEEEIVIKEDLNKLLEYMSELDNINVEGVSELTNPINEEIKAPLHKDEPKEFENRNKIIENFPEKKDNYLRVPGIHG